MNNSDENFVSPYLLRPARSELAAATVREYPKNTYQCPRCDVRIPIGEEPDGCRDPDCPIMMMTNDPHRDDWEGS